MMIPKDKTDCAYSKLRVNIIHLWAQALRPYNEQRTSLSHKLL